MNVFGVDVRSLDVLGFVSTMRQLFPVLALAWLALLLRVRRAWWLVAGVVLANAYVWLETSWPLQRLYALGPSSDRLNNVAMVQPVAAGHSPLYTAQVGHVQFEPFWSLLMAALSGFDTERLLAVYALMPLVVAAGVALSLYAALRPIPGTAEHAWSPWERAVVAGMATLLFSAPLDFSGPYRVPWAMTYLLKPNHAIGLLIAPWVARAVAAIARGRDRVVAALFLHLLGWAFVMHMGVFCLGLAAFAALSLGLRRPDGRSTVADVAVVIGLNLLIVSPYLVMLSRGFNLLQSGPRLEIPPGSPHLLEATTRMPWLTALALWGAVVAWRRDRLGRVWAGQLAGAFVLWLSYFALHFVQQAKERDDAYYWVRFVLAVCAAVGAWDVAGRVASALRGLGRASATVPARLAAALDPPHVRAAALALLLLPASLPYWYDPPRMDLYFTRSVEPIPEIVRAPIAALVARGERVGVLAGDFAASRWAAALAGFRVLQAKDFPAAKDYRRKMSFVEALLGGRDTAQAHALARGYGVTHLIVTPELLAQFPVTSLGALESRRDLEPLHVSRDGEAYVAVFELAYSGG